MHPSIAEYLKGERVCVLAVEMPDGAPHAATVHFTYIEEPLTFIVLTNPSTRKYEAFVKNPARATMVIGTTEETLRTFQLDGGASLSDDTELRKLYDEKFPKAAHLFPKDVLFTFTPTWWRFTDWSRPEGKTIYVSDGSIWIKGIKQ